MTNKEALQAVIQATVPDLSLEKALLDQGITGAEPYAATGATVIDLAAVAVLQGLLSAQDVSEGGYSVKQRERKAIETRLLYLAKKHGLTEISTALQPTISSKSPW